MIWNWNLLVWCCDFPFCLELRERRLSIEYVHLLVTQYLSLSMLHGFVIFLYEHDTTCFLSHFCLEGFAFLASFWCLSLKACVTPTDCSFSSALVLAPSNPIIECYWIGWLDKFLKTPLFDDNLNIFGGKSHDSCRFPLKSIDITCAKAAFDRSWGGWLFLLSLAWQGSTLASHMAWKDENFAPRLPGVGLADVAPF